MRDDEYPLCMDRPARKSPLTAYPALLWVTVLSALLGSFQFGYHLGILNTALYWLTKDLHLDFAKEGAIVVSAVLVGAVVGSLFAGQAADAMGPKKALLINNAWLVVGCVLCAATPGGYWGLLAGRALAGVGAGAASLYVPRYVSEVSPISIRGGLATLNQAFICVGILVAYLVGLPYQYNTPQAITLGGATVSWWRVMFIIGLIPAILQAVCLLFLPESPVWLSWKGRAAAALQAEHQLLGASAETEGEVEERQAPAAGGREEEAMANGTCTLPEQQEGRAATGGWGALLKRRYRRIMVLASSLPIWQQASGINTVVFYSSDVFAKAGLQSPVVGSIIVGSVNVAGTLLAATIMDRAGRRQMLLASHCIMAACLAALAVSSYLPVSAALQGTLSLVAVMGFVLGFACGSGPVPWIYLSEVLPNEIKGPAAALCTSLNWISNLAVGLTFPSMLAALHLGGAYSVYAGLNAVAAVFVGCLMVETKQRSLAAIQTQLLLPDT